MSLPSCSYIHTKIKVTTFNAFTIHVVSLCDEMFCIYSPLFPPSSHLAFSLLHLHSKNAVSQTQNHGSSNMQSSCNQAQRLRQHIPSQRLFEKQGTNKKRYRKGSMKRQAPSGRFFLFLNCVTCDICSHPRMHKRLLWQCLAGFLYAVVPAGFSWGACSLQMAFFFFLFLLGGFFCDVFFAFHLVHTSCWRDRWMVWLMAWVVNRVNSSLLFL